MPYKTWLWAGMLLALPWVAHAAGLGKLAILSALGQPLLAEVDLVSVHKDELATLTARISPPEAFTKANIRYSPALVGVRLSIERRADGQPYLKIISTRPVNEPFIDLLVELNWAQGRLVREYTALIDPPGYTPVPLAQFAPVAPAAPIEAAPAAPSLAPAAPVEAAAPAAPSLAPAAPVEAAAPATPSLAPAAPIEAAAPAAPLLAPAAPVEAAPAAPLLAPAAPVEAAPAATAPAAKRPAAARAKVESKEYGPVKHGDTLSKIATRVKPEGITLEQMLVSLYHANSDAFSGNMNRLKAGKILRIPEQQIVAAVEQSEAATEVRVQAADWNAYRRRLADAAGETPARESKSAASGKITTAVDDKAAGKATPKEVLKLSKGEQPTVPGKAGSGKGAPRRAAERARMLEEEAAAREKALTEANERIAQLEKTVKNMQRLLEVKGQVPGVPEAAVSPPPAKTEPAKMAPGDAGKTTAEAPGSGQPAVPVAQPAAAGPPQGEALKAEAPKAEAGAPAQPKPKPVNIIVQAPPDLIDQILEEPLYLVAGGGLLTLLGGMGFWFVRRRGQRVKDEERKRAKIAPQSDINATTLTAPVAGGEEVDSLAEADLYLSFGRDEQAEEVLKEALEQDPSNEEAELRLLQIYAGRSDRAAFEKIARNLHARTQGTGENWLKAATLGYALDSGNALYGAGKQAPAASGAAPAADADFELLPSVSTVAGEPDAGAAEGSLVEQLGKRARAVEAQDIADAGGTAHAAADAAAEAAMPDFMLSFQDRMQLPAAPEGEAVKTGVTGEPAAPMAGMIDFDATPLIPPGDGEDNTRDGANIPSPGKHDPVAGMDFEPAVDGAGAESDTGPEAAGPADMAIVFPDFKLELADDAAVPHGPDLKLGGINLNLGDTTDGAVTKAPEPEGGAKDGRWYDVQTKFDLAKAYQEMGDKDGTREILREVIKEGDAGQQAAAKKLLDSLA